MPPPASSSLRQPNTYLTVSQQQSSVLAARIASKKAELDNLKQLCEMSGALAMQMHSLEQKIGTLKDGTEGSLILVHACHRLSLTTHSYTSSSVMNG
jgi:DASH complex subunit DAD2